MITDETFTISDMEIFTITNDHFKLLQNICISWNDCKFGVPAIKCKRPYGTLDIELDIAQILEWDIKDDNTSDRYIFDNGLTLDQHTEAMRIHVSLGVVLAICIDTLSFEVGTYGYDRDRWKWVRINE